MRVDLLTNKEFTLQQKADTLSVTAKTFLNLLISVPEVSAEMNAVTHTNQIFSSRKLCFLEGGRAVIKSEYTDIGLKILKLFDSELNKKTERELSYQIDSADENTPKITLVHADGPIYGTYYADKELSVIKTSDTFTEETYSCGKKGEIISFTTAMQPDYQKAACWFRWINATTPFKWDDSYGTAHLDVKYGDRERNVLDLYVPKNFDFKRQNGVIFAIHGGGWLVGDKSAKSGIAAYFAKYGYFTAAINYSFISLENKSSIFTILDELAAAVAKVKEMSDMHGFNITKAAAMGESAGGHLSLMHAYSQNGRGGIPVLFAATEAGPIDMRPGFWQNLTTEQQAALEFAPAGTGQPMTIEEAKNGKYDELLKKISPINFVDTAVPTLIMQGLLDQSVNPATGKVLSDALKKRNIRHEYVEFPNSNHSGMLDAPLRRKYDSLVLRYLKEHFGY